MLIVSFSFASTKILPSFRAFSIFCCNRAIAQVQNERLPMSKMVDFLNPQMIVLGGGLVDAMPDIITQEVAAGIKSHATPEAQQGLQTVPSKLKSHAVTTGAAKLAVDSL
jgi:predicted NBD/HSP70 family sugar kinase